MELNISIKRTENGNLGAFCAHEMRFELFQFAYRKELKSWLFWLRGNYDPQQFTDQPFPMKFFKDACRAKYFLTYGTEIPDSVKIVSGSSFIKKLHHEPL